MGDRWAAEDPDRVALIWEKDEPGEAEHVTYGQLLEMVCRLANVLSDAGVVSGDVVALYMPVSPLAVATMLATSRLGAIHNVVFAGFSAEALAARVRDAGARVIVTADEALRGGKRIPLKSTVDRALKECKDVSRDEWMEEAMTKVSPKCSPTMVDSEHPLFLLYTSGSTGKPKGIRHSSAGYLLYAAVTHRHVFDFQPGDVFGCVADIGWITGHSYVVYGPLANGGTSLLFEPTPTLSPG